MIEEILNNKSDAIVDYSNFDISQLGRAAAFGGAMLLIGMLTIFAVLILLWGCLVIFKKVFHDIPEAKASKASSETVVEEAVAPAIVAESSDDELIAVIAAAVAMAESESSGMKFRVVSFKRI